ncbi:MAG: Gfo/Idh/MocA family oxidoreductase [Planctomycetes bacterium]|nr:Gfo/Idh/MocA family oxidoreductase [Planctomycetota bacterium]
MASGSIRIGFVGGGYMGQLAHIENYWKLPGVELVALAEGRAKTAELVAKTYGIREVYPHHSEMLKKSQIDAVVAITPFHLNAELVEDALKAGKHVITEKPQVNTSAKGRELAELAEAKKLVYQVGYMKRCDPGVRWAKAKIAEWKASGAFGPFLSLRIWCCHGAWQWFHEPALSIQEDFPKYPSRVESKPEWMTENGWKAHTGWTNYYSHQTNLARYAAGEDYKLESIKRNTIGETTSFFGTGAFTSGAQITLDFPSHVSNHWDEGFEVYFQRAKLVAKIPAPLASRQCAEVIAFENPASGEAREIRPSLLSMDGFAEQARHFVRSILGEEAPRSTAAEALKEVELSEEIIRKMQAQGALK